MSYGRALTAFEIRRWKLARKYLAEELAENPESADAYALLAATDLNMGETKKAVEHAKTAIGIDPNRPYAYYIFGLALLKDKQNFEAEIALEEALAKDPCNPTYLTVCAGLYRMYDKKGMELLDRALEQDPTYLAALHAKYERLVANKKNNEAEILRKQILELDPEDASMHEASGWKSLLERDGHARAVDHFRESLRLNPNEHGAVAGLQEAQYQLHNPLARGFKKFGWSKIFVSASVLYVISIGYLLACDHWHLEVSTPVAVVTCVVPVGILLVGGLVYLAGITLYYIGLIVDGWKRKTVQNRIRQWFSGRWWTKVGAFAAGLAIAGVPIALDINKVHLPLPRWLYEDWLPVFPSIWRGVAYFVPVIFVIVLTLLIVSSIRLIRAHKNKDPLSTHYFTSWLIFFTCWAVLSLYALVAVFGSTPWFVYVVLLVEFTIIVVPLSPVYRNYVKAKLRAHGERMR